MVAPIVRRELLTSERLNELFADKPNPGLDYMFDPGTADANPGSGKLRFNNVAWGSASFIYVSKTDRLGANLGTVIGALFTSGAHIRLFPTLDRTQYVECDISGAPTDATTYWKIPITSVVASAAMPIEGTLLCFLANVAGPTGLIGPGYKATSTSSIANAASGSKSFTTQAGLAYAVGARVRATETSAGHWMEGVVTAYSGTSLTFTADLSDGDTGTYTAWNINLAGQRGATGSTGATGPGFAATSTTSLANAATGSKAFTTQAGLAYATGSRIRATSAATGHWMEGVVSSYSGTTLTVTMDKSDGNTGTYADWNINVAGEPGANGAGAGDMLAANDLSDLVSKQAGFDNLSLKGADVASAATLDLDSATGSILDVTGTTTVTAVTLASGRRRWVRATGAWTIQNGANLITGTGADIVLAANDWVMFAGYPSSKVYVVDVKRASGKSLVGPAAADITDSTATGRSVLTAADAPTARAAVYAAPFDALAYNGLQVNGGMEVSQRYGATAITGLGAGQTGTYPLDGAYLGIGGSVVVTAQQVTDAPAGYNNSLKLSVTTATGTLGSSDVLSIVVPIEGYRCARLAWGTASARPLALGFWVKAHRAGTYSGSIRNAASARSYPFSFTISSADTWEFKTVTLAGDTSGTWDTTTGVGIYLTLAVAAGSSVVGTAGAWAGANYAGVTGTLNGAQATTDTFQVTGVVVLPGLELPSSTYASLLTRPYDQSLELCQRYYRALLAQSNGIFITHATAGGVDQIDGMYEWDLYMRVAPSLVVSATAADYGISDGAGGSGANCTSVPAFVGAGIDRALIRFTKTLHGIGNATMCRHRQINATGILHLDARL